MKRLRLFLLPAIAAAQLQVYTVDGTQETAVGGIVELGRTSTGDILQKQFRVRNGIRDNACSVALTAQLQTLAIEGHGFRLLQDPPLPFPLTPCFSVDFYVQFQSDLPIFDARAVLRINNSVVSLIASAAPSPVVLVTEEDGSLSRKPAGQATVFPSVERGSSAMRVFTILNAHPVGLTTRLTVSGDSFQLLSIVPAPLTLDGGQSFPIQIRFQPAAAGIRRGALHLDDRVFPLEGVGTDPLPPRPSIAIPAHIESAKQVRIAVTFAEPAKADARGTLWMEFQPSMTGPDDAAIGFLPNLRRQMDFIVRAGQTQAEFGAAKELVLQTGTTSGTLRFRADLGGFQADAAVTISPAPPVLDKLAAIKTTDTIDMTIFGFDNTRSISEFAFTFYDTSGVALEPGVIRSNVTDAFKRYFDTTPTGGMFSMRAVFPVRGSPAGIAHVEIEVHNAAGTTRSQRITF